MSLLSPSQKPHQQAVDELISSEEQYLEDITAVLKVFSQDVLCDQLGLVTQPEYSRMFGTLQEVIKGNIPLLQDLKARKHQTPAGVFSIVSMDILCLMRMTV